MVARHTKVSIGKQAGRRALASALLVPEIEDPDLDAIILRVIREPVCRDWIPFLGVTDNEAAFVTALQSGWVTGDYLRDCEGENRYPYHDGDEKQEPADDELV